MFLQSRGPSLWATAILTPLPGQTTKITFYIVINAVGPLLLGLMNAHGGEAERGDARRGHGLSMPMFVSSPEGKIR